MTDDEKRDLRAWLKPESPEPTDAEFRILRDIRDEVRRRWEASRGAPRTPADVKRVVEESVRELGIDPASVGPVTVTIVR